MRVPDTPSERTPLALPSTLRNYQQYRYQQWFFFRVSLVYIDQLIIAFIISFIYILVNIKVSYQYLADLSQWILSYSAANSFPVIDYKLDQLLTGASKSTTLQLLTINYIISKYKGLFAGQSTALRISQDYTEQRSVSLATKQKRDLYSINRKLINRNKILRIDLSKNLNKSLLRLSYVKLSILKDNNYYI